MFFIFAWFVTTTVLLTTALPQPRLGSSIHLRSHKTGIFPRQIDGSPSDHGNRRASAAREYGLCISDWTLEASKIGWPSLASIQAAEEACYDAVAENFGDMDLWRTSPEEFEDMFATLRPDLVDTTDTVEVPPPVQGNTPEEGLPRRPGFNPMTRIRLQDSLTPPGLWRQMKSYMFNDGGRRRPGVGSPASPVHPVRPAAPI